MAFILEELTSFFHWRDRVHTKLEDEVRFDGLRGQFHMLNEGSGSLYTKPYL